MALLLTPREREAERQKERERLVRDSEALNQRANQLRELEQSSKKRLQDFQEKEFAKVQEEKEARRVEIERLDARIAERQKEWAQLLEPLDRQFALYVKTERGKIETEQARQASEATRLAAQESAQGKKDHELSVRALELTQEKHAVASIQEKAKQDAVEAQKTLQAANAHYKRLSDKAEELVKTASETLQKAKIELRDAEIKRETQDRREKELEDRELAVVIKELEWYSPVKKPLSVNK